MYSCNFVVPIWGVWRLSVSAFVSRQRYTTRNLRHCAQTANESAITGETVFFVRSGEKTIDCVTTGAGQAHVLHGRMVKLRSIHYVCEYEVRGSHDKCAAASRRSNSFLRRVQNSLHAAVLVWDPS